MFGAGHDRYMGRKAAMITTKHARFIYGCIAATVVTLLLFGVINTKTSYKTLPWQHLPSIRVSMNAWQYREQMYTSFYRPWNVTGNVNCTKLANGDTRTIEYSKEVMKTTERKGPSANFFANIADCENFKTSRGYIEDSLSTSEESFPLAFGFVVYKDVEQVERLLRAIYRTHNFYCFHVDSKSESVVKSAFKKLAGCFPNVFLVDAPVDVKWGDITVLRAELLLMECLWKYKWRYYINLTGQEFPLKTNLEIVEILRAMQGANIVLGMETKTRTKLQDRYKKSGKPPPGINLIAGSVHVAINRDFVDFTLHDDRSKAFIKWLKSTFIPDEFFFSSLNHSPDLGIPGTFLGEAEEYPLKPFFMRYKNWFPTSGDSYRRKCHGKFVREVCILGVGDIHKALDDIGLFANKFYLDFEYLGLDCLEQYLYERTWDQYLHDRVVDVSYYKALHQVKYRLRKNDTH